ncbi:MAG: PRC-barrel domain-containing protein [Planctomycetaceae bacterium]|nr:PRC-barrel domain-containing protein [Planctomycetaceae bacterium]
MEKRTWSALFVGGLALSVSSLVLSQERKPDAVPKKADVQQNRTTLTETTKRVESRSTDFRRSSLMIGANVNLRGGTRYGKIHEFVISDQGCVDYVIVAHEDRFIPVPWSVTTFDPGQRVVLVDIEQDRIRTIPTFVEYTEFTAPAFIGRVNTFFNVDVRVRDSDRSRPRDPQRDDRPNDRPRTKTQDDPAPTRPTPDADRNPGTEKTPSTEKNSDAPKSTEKKLETEKKVEVEKKVETEKKPSEKKSEE